MTRPPQPLPMISLSHLRHPTFLLILGAFLISFSGVWVKFANVSPSSSAFYRVFFGFLFLGALSLRSGELKNQQWMHFFLASLCGLLFAGDLLFWHNSIVLIGPGLATLLGNFQVFILAGVGILILRERYGIALLLAIPLAMAGLVLVIGNDWFVMGATYRTGVYFGLATALFYSAFLLTLRYVSASSPGKYFPMTLSSLVASIALGCYIHSSGDTFAIPDLASLLSLACLGFFSQTLGWLLIAFSLPKNNASYAGLILLLQPSLAFVWDVIIFARPTSTLNWLGVVLTLFSIYLGISSRQKKS